jgi:hypothetical protein
MYGEFVTNAFESLTPVVGAQVFSGGSSQVITDIGLAPVNEPVLEPDSHNSRSTDGSLKVVAEAGDGVQTTPFMVEDFAHTEVQFDLYFPKTTLNQGISLDAGLISQYGAVQLILPELVGDQWQRCRVPLTKGSLQQTGNYRFFLVNQDQTTWWIDNVQIVQYTIAWSGRAVADDAWNAFQDDWTDFKHMTDNSASGALFSERGKYLQIRGQTLTDTAGFDKVYIKPKYAELGRFTWDTGRQYR